jgi:hypothetical protein
MSTSSDSSKGLLKLLSASNPERRDTLTLRGHSVFPRIAVKGMQPTLLLAYPAVPCSTLESPCLPCALVTIWSLSISAWAMKAMAFALVLPVAGGREQDVQQVQHRGRPA